MKILMIYCFLATLTVSAKEKPFTLKGEMEGSYSGYIYIGYPASDEKYKTDSALVTKGHFAFQGNVSEPVMASLTTNTKSRLANDPNRVYFFIEPGTIKIFLKYNSFADAKIKGSKNQAKMDEIKQYKSQI